jgi:uncharacterized protein YecE (DUF72 family)
MIDIEKRIRIGTAGWSYEDWKGIVYPASGQKFDPLAYLASYFDTIEINTTFYRPPAPTMSSSWSRRVGSNPNFRFTAKLYQNFTHQRKDLTAKDEKAFKEGIAPLMESGRLGALLIQFPYSFHNTEDNRSYLDDLARSFSDYPLVLEVRHRSWDRPFVYEKLKGLGIGFCNIDQPPVSYSMGKTQRVTGPIGYLRLHGRNADNWFRKDAGRDARYDYLYGDREIEEIVQRVDRISSEASETYIIANNHFRGQAACNALQLKFKFEGEEIPVPETLKAHYPQLKIPPPLS